mgnify:FL=1
MELNYMKDHLFDLVNESEWLDVKGIETDDRRNTLRVTVADGTVFVIECRKEAGK